MRINGVEVGPVRAAPQRLPTRMAYRIAFALHLFGARNWSFGLTVSVPGLLCRPWGRSLFGGDPTRTARLGGGVSVWQPSSVPSSAGSMRPVLAAAPVTLGQGPPD